MLTILKSKDRGETNTSWLNSKHSFSFGDYHNPDLTSYSDLRVINEDIVLPGQGFGMHPHRNMEIVTFVLSGSLIHKDSLGSESVLSPGVIQKMSAGKGILHSEYNNSDILPLHLLQIWIMPERTGIMPDYQEAKIEYKDNMAHLASPKNQGGAVTINQDAQIFAMRSFKNEKITKKLDSSRKYWIQVVRGSALINDIAIEQGDAIQLEGEDFFNYYSDLESEILFFDLRA